VSSLVLLFRDLFALLRPAKLALLLSVAVLAQIAYWYLGSPGPQLLASRADTPRSLEAALPAVLWAAVFLFALPAAFLLLTGDSLRRLGLQLGDAVFGSRLVLIALPIATAALFVGLRFPELQTTYPWAGAWPGRSPLHLLAWSGLYALYYLAYEFFYRGFLLRGLEPYWGLEAAIWVQTLASTLLHLGKPVAETLGAIPMGLIFALVAVRGRSLLWPFLLHLAIGLLTDIFSLWRQGWLL
jgi:membrane protease YdiL (CAAX protease family)